MGGESSFTWFIMWPAPVRQLLAGWWLKETLLSAVGKFHILPSYVAVYLLRWILTYNHTHAHSLAQILTPHTNWSMYKHTCDLWKTQVSCDIQPQNFHNISETPVFENRYKQLTTGATQWQWRWSLESNDVISNPAASDLQFKTLQLHAHIW